MAEPLNACARISAPQSGSMPLVAQLPSANAPLDADTKPPQT
jgi:hypothetical protein